jgi:hypothetical protein
MLYSDGLMDTIGYSFMDTSNGYQIFKNTNMFEPLYNNFDAPVHGFMKKVSAELLDKTSGDPVDDICVLTIQF